jgi:hypothetical protein
MSDLLDNPERGAGTIADGMRDAEDGASRSPEGKAHHRSKATVAAVQRDRFAKLGLSVERHKDPTRVSRSRLVIPAGPVARTRGTGLG